MNEITGRIMYSARINGPAVDLRGGAHKERPMFNAPPSPPATDIDTDTEPELSPILPTVQKHRPGAFPDAILAASSDTIPFPSLDSTEATGPVTLPELPPRPPPSVLPISPPITSPPYWTHNHQHARTISTSSADSIPIGGITLRDNETSSFDDRGSACWAKSVDIVDHVIVNGSATNIGAFVVWIIQVETLTGTFINIRKRYSEFDDLRWRLMRTFPNFEAAVPELPPKSIISKFRPRFLEKRRAGLQYFLNCILLNPEFSGSPVLKEFLFS
jgi:hypothetical protein